MLVAVQLNSCGLITRRSLLLGSKLTSGARRDLHWPATPNPTPYQIFGLEPNTAAVDKKKLRSIYFELVKMYHPDRGSTGDADRFKKVVDAHNILKDESRRRSYDMTQAQTGFSGTSPQYYKQQSNSFEDDIDYNYWSNQNQQKFDQNLYESRMWVLKFVTTVTITFTIINMIMLKEATETRNEALNYETERAAAQLALSSTNHGHGNSAQDRINRFLDDRQRMLDRFDNEFRWDKFKAGMTRNPPRSNAKPAREEDHLVEDTPFEGGHASKIGEPQMKHHTGPVAEYFGRN